MTKNFNLIAVLGGGLKKDVSGWRTTGYNERGDNFGVQGDRLRVDAAYQLFKDLSRKNKDLIVISSGGKGQLRGVIDAPTIASVIKKELLALGIPEEKILLEENSNNTSQQLKEISRIILEKNFQSIVVISSQWHLPRVKAMIEYGPGLDLLKEKLANGSIVLVSAEQVLIDSDPSRWKEMIGIALGSAAMRERIKKEEQGVSQIKSGLYKFQ